MVEVLVCWTVWVSNPIIFLPSWLGEKGHKKVCLLCLLSTSFIWAKVFPQDIWGIRATLSNGYPSLRAHGKDTAVSWGALPLGRAGTWWPPRGRDRTRFKLRSIDFGWHSLGEAKECPHGESKSCLASWVQNLMETTPWSIWVLPEYHSGEAQLNNLVPALSNYSRIRQIVFTGIFRLQELSQSFYKTVRYSHPTRDNYPSLQGLQIFCFSLKKLLKG